MHSQSIFFPAVANTSKSGSYVATINLHFAANRKKNSIQTMQLCSVEHCFQILSRRHLENNWRCAPSSTNPSYPILLETLATPWNSVGQCSLETLYLVSSSKVASSGLTLRLWKSVLLLISQCIKCIFISIDHKTYSLWLHLSTVLYSIRNLRFVDQKRQEVLFNYKLFLAFKPIPQLVSRISHPNRQLYIALPNKIEQ